jgi:F0F1-type ATP synthase membrane subunit c/vacuolar-type H+-ATPase subunit K
MSDPLLVRRILWAALLVSQGIYVWVLAFSGAVPPPMEPPDPMLPMVLGAVALSVAVASFVVPMLLLRSASGASQHAPSGRQQAHARTFTPFIVSLAMSEAVSIFGLVAGYLGHPALVWAPFFAAGFVLTAWRFPTEGRMMGPLARGNGVTVG